MCVVIHTFQSYLIHFIASLIYVNNELLNLRMAAVSAFVALSAEHKAFWHALPTERLICARKIVSFVVRNDFTTPHRKELKLRKQ